jgi:aldehyde dehydrogenase (NAD+)
MSVAQSEPTIHRRLFVGGQWVEAGGADSIEVVDPSTEERIGLVPEATVEEVDAAVAAAARAFPEWAATEPRDRAELLRRLATGLRSRHDELGDLVVREVGTPARLAHGHQVAFPIDALDVHADLIESTPYDERVGHSIVAREPIGVVAALAPWNFPLLLAMNKIAPALAAGCTVVLKPSEITPLHAFVLAEEVERAELPPGVFNLVTGRGPVVGEALAAHPRVDMVSLTGSTAAGRRVAELGARNLKRVHLELGGKSANVVLDDADVELAVRRGIEQCYWNSGQNCMAWSRMLVPRERHDEIVGLARDVAAAQRVGPPADESTDVGPLVSAAQAERVRGDVRGAVEEGARVVTGGAGRPEGFDRGFYVQPTVLAGVHNDMRVAREEIFGPVLAVIPYSSEDEAVEIANDTDYGLHGAVFSADRDRALGVARRMRTGMVDVNGAELNPEAPFGGYKQSGLGRELGRWGLDEYFELKSIQL